MKQSEPAGHTAAIYSGKTVAQVFHLFPASLTFQLFVPLRRISENEWPQLQDN